MACFAILKVMVLLLVSFVGFEIKLTVDHVWADYRISKVITCLQEQRNDFFLPSPLQWLLFGPIPEQPETVDVLTRLGSCFSAPIVCWNELCEKQDFARELDVMYAERQASILFILDAVFISVVLVIAGLVRYLPRVLAKWIVETTREACGEGNAPDASSDSKSTMSDASSSSSAIEEKTEERVVEEPVMCSYSEKTEELVIEEHIPCSYFEVPETCNEGNSPDANSDSESMVSGDSLPCSDFEEMTEERVVEEPVMCSYSVKKTEESVIEEHISCSYFEVPETCNEGNSPDANSDSESMVSDDSLPCSDFEEMTKELMTDLQSCSDMNNDLEMTDLQSCSDMSNVSEMTDLQSCSDMNTDSDDMEELDSDAIMTQIRTPRDIFDASDYSDSEAEDISPFWCDCIDSEIESYSEEVEKEISACWAAAEKEAETNRQLNPFLKTPVSIHKPKDLWKKKRSKKIRKHATKVNQEQQPRGQRPLSKFQL